MLSHFCWQNFHYLPMFLVECLSIADLLQFLSSSSFFGLLEVNFQVVSSHEPLHLMPPNSTGIEVEPELKNLAAPFHRPPARSVQGFQRMEDSGGPVGQPMMHLSAPLQASGEAHYTDDIPKQEGELYAGLVISTHAHAKITVDWSLILHLDEVHGYVAVEDVPASNVTGLFADEKVFADGEVTHFGQIIGMVLADNQLIAQRAAKLVKVTYTDLPSIITIEVAFITF